MCMEQVTKTSAMPAKTINFGVLYGMSAHGLSVATGMSREEATEFIQRYFAVRPRCVPISITPSSLPGSMSTRKHSSAAAGPARR